jgi:hypothetical protein
LIIDARLERPATFCRDVLHFLSSAEDRKGERRNNSEPLSADPPSYTATTYLGRLYGNLHTILQYCTLYYTNNLAAILDAEPPIPILNRNFPGPRYCRASCKQRPLLQGSDMQNRTPLYLCRMEMNPYCTTTLLSRCGCKELSTMSVRPRSSDLSHTIQYLCSCRDEIHPGYQGSLPIYLDIMLDQDKCSSSPNSATLS